MRWDVAKECSLAPTKNTLKRQKVSFHCIDLLAVMSFLRPKGFEASLARPVHSEQNIGAGPIVSM